MMLFFTVAIIWGVNNYLYRQKVMEEPGYAKGVVTYLRNSKGVRVSLYPFITYKFTVDGKQLEGNQKAEEGLYPSIGDCIEIIYSRQDPEVSAINFKRGIIPCQ